MLINTNSVISHSHLLLDICVVSRFLILWTICYELFINILHRQAFSIPLGKYLKVEMHESFNKCICKSIKQFTKIDVQLCIFDKTWKFLLL